MATSACITFKTFCNVNKQTICLNTQNKYKITGTDGKNEKSLQITQLDSFIFDKSIYGM